MNSNYVIFRFNNFVNEIKYLHTKLFKIITFLLFFNTNQYYL